MYVYFKCDGIGNFSFVCGYFRLCIVYLYNENWFEEN